MTRVVSWNLTCAEVLLYLRNGDGPQMFQYPQAYAEGSHITRLPHMLQSSKLPQGHQGHSNTPLCPESYHTAWQEVQPTLRAGLGAALS